MIIPPAKDRLQFYTELVSKCEASLPDRRTNYDSYRQYYLQGSLGNSKNVYQNRIRDKINLLSAFLYAQENVKFGITFNPGVPPEQKLYTDTMREIAQMLWHNTDAKSLFGEAVTWALVDGCRIKKIAHRPHGGIKTYMVEPACFAVLREDIDSLDDQEAMVMTYHITESELRRQIFNHPERDRIMGQLSSRKRDDNLSTIPETVTRIIISQVSPSMIGSANVDGQGLRVDYQPRVEEPLVECRELWVWDDSLRDGKGDYRVWTAAVPDVTIYDRPNIFIPSENPFTKVCAFPLPNYFWGLSLVGAQIGLQDWRDKRLGQIDQTLLRQLRPSRIGIGAGPLSSEKALALDSPGGYHSFPQPNAKIETYKPELPPDAWKLIADIDEQMDEITGITRTLKGRGDEGIRAEGHAQFLGRMGSAPLRRRALNIESNLEDEITLMMKLFAREDATEYIADKTKDGKREKFLLSQVSPDYRIKVSAHSSSPIFAEENKQMADGLFKAGAIDKRTLVEMLDPPMIDTILARLPALEEAQSEVAKLKAQQEQSKTVKNVAQAEAAKAKIGLVR